MGGRLEAGGGLSDIAERMVGDRLALDGAIRPDTKEHHAASAVQEGAERLHALLQLSRRALELQSLTLAVFHEGGELFRVRGTPHGGHGGFLPPTFFHPSGRASSGTESAGKERRACRVEEGVALHPPKMGRMLRQVVTEKTR